MKFSKLAVSMLLLAAASGPLAAEIVQVQEGEAAYYSNRFHGKRTASGDVYDKNAMTAAHHTFKFGTKVRVTDTTTGKSVDVVINDRMPKSNKRIIDLSRAAASKLGLIKRGYGQVKLETF